MRKARISIRFDAQLSELRYLASNEAISDDVLRQIFQIPRIRGTPFVHELFEGVVLLGP